MTAPTPSDDSTANYENLAEQDVPPAAPAYAAPPDESPAAEND